MLAARGKREDGELFVEKVMLLFTIRVRKSGER